VRQLIYAPIVHTAADLGSMAGELRQRFIEALGEDAWNRRGAAVEAMWDGLRERLLALPLEWPKVKLYQDGLPVCGREAVIVRDVAAQGSRNHQLLLELMARGAELMGTEDATLLVRELERARRLVAAASKGMTGEAARELERQGQELLQQRDAFIARRIDETLVEGETGIVFIGLLHRLDELVEGRFETTHAIGSLPLFADTWSKLKERPGHGH
jgi:hypothetical protein